MAKEQTNHPSYYNMYSIEAVEMARKIWGSEALKTCAEITAFFYRMRAGLKENVSIETDLAKEEWWLDYATRLSKEGEKENTPTDSSKELQRYG